MTTKVPVRPTPALLEELEHANWGKRHPKVWPAGEMELSDEALWLPVGDVAHLLDAEFPYCVVHQNSHILDRHTDIPIGPAALVWPILGTFTLLSLLQVGHHDNGGCVLFPYHSPEIIHRFFFWSLCSNEFVLFLVAINE